MNQGRSEGICEKDNLEHLFTLAAQQFKRGKSEQAGEMYRQILHDHPDHPRALHALGIITFHSGNVAGAIKLIQRALEVQPDFADALNNLGNIFREQGKLDDALSCYQRAISINPRLALAHFNRGNIFRVLGRLNEALDCYGKAVAVKPDFADAFSRWGAILTDLERFDEAIVCYGKALAVNPDLVEVHNYLGNLYVKLRKFGKAKASYEKALKLNPDFAETYLNLGNLYLSRNKSFKAANTFITAIGKKPDYAAAFNNLGNAYKNQSRIEEAIENYRMALRINPGWGEVRSNLLLAMHYSHVCSAESIFNESVAWQKECAGNIRRRDGFCCNPHPAKRLRIGYVSADFGRHPVGYFLSPVLSSHDRTRIETYCYSNRTSEDDLTMKLKNSADHWRCIAGITDDNLADIILADQIDILVDLSGHMGGNRLRVFAQKPAPVQVTWAGYVGTTGLSAIDYIISDWQETPKESDQWYVEKVIRLPECFVCYEPPEYAPAVSEPPAQLNGYITFGCFNNLAKLNGKVIALWSQILNQVTDSRLLLITRELNDLDTRKSLLKEFKKFGVADRVTLSGSLPHAKLLASYNRVDITLDPFPYSGGMTTLESLWMGVPVVTLGGERFSSRHSLSYLTTAGLSEFIVTGPEAYIARVTSLASDLAKLTDIRLNLRGLVSSSPLCDALRFTQNLEIAYREMWQAWCTTFDALPTRSRTITRECTTTGTQPENLFTIAETLFQQGRLQLAESLYNRILFDNPDHPRALNALGMIAHCSGNEDEAINLMRRAIKIKPDEDICNNLGKVLKEQGKLEDALVSFREAIAIRPNFADALCNMGNTLMDLGRHDEALTCFQKTLEVNPDQAQALCDMGVVLSDLGRPAEAIASYRKAVTVKPDFIAAFNNLANVLLDLGRRSEAVACYREAIRIDPAFAEGHYNLGNALEASECQVEAVACYREAVRLNPAFVEGYNNLGNLLRKQGAHNEAVVFFRMALRLKPGFAEVHNNLGVALKEMGKGGDAVECYKQAIACDPEFAEAYSNLGDVLWSMGRLDEAVAKCRKALELRGNFSDAHYNLGNALNKQGKLAEAVENYERALSIDPESAPSYNNLANALTAQGKLDESIASYRHALDIKPDYPEAHSNLLLTMNYASHLTGLQIFEESLRWDRIHAAPWTATRSQHTNKRDADRRLRIGYVSPDFRRHSVSYFLEPLLVAHNRKVVEIYCYAEVVKADEFTLKMQALADRWLYTSGMTDDAVAARIREDRIDILVDLAGHTAGNRLMVFAQKPAPIQVTWLGYPSTTGLSAMDYRLTDTVADPPGLSDRFHSETLVRLPDSFLCYVAPSDSPRVIKPPATWNSHLTFGSFNNLAKTTEEVIELWGRLLNRLGGSRLILKNNSFDDESTRSRYLDKFRKYGINPSHISLLSMTSNTRSHLELYGGIDIALDPFPYNGTTTTCEALWMGVPVVTLSGDRHAGRVGASILHQVGLDDLVAETPEDYVRIAIDLGNDRNKLAALRRSLRERMSCAPLCDAAKFAQKVESAYRKMWHRWCVDQGES